MEEKGEVCVTGASGFIGSWLTMRLLRQGYAVRATLRDPSNMMKAKHLLNLPGASEKLTLWKADLKEEGSFDEAINGCIGVFHLATPSTDLEDKDPENELVKPMIEGTLDVLRSCVKAKTVRRVILTSTAGAAYVTENKMSVYDENSWTDVEYCKAKEEHFWMYLCSKASAEKKAFEFAEKNGFDLITILPPIVTGPFLEPTMPYSVCFSLALLTGTVEYYPIIKSCNYVHVDDLCSAQIFLFENKNANGRYICSSHYVTSKNFADMLRKKYPENEIPTDEQLESVVGEEYGMLSSKKLMELGFEFKYDLEGMIDDAVHSCQEKGLALNFVPKKQQA